MGRIFGRAFILQFALTPFLLQASSLSAQTPDRIGTWAPTEEEAAPSITPSASAGSSWMFGVDNSGNLLQINPLAMQASRIGPTGRLIFDLAFTPDGQLYGITDGRILVRINPATGQSTAVGTGLGLPNNDTVNALVSDPQGTLYAITFHSGFFGNSGDLLRISRSSGRAQIVGALNVNLGSSGDLAFSPDGRLFGIGTDGADDFLLRINPQTGAATIVGFLSDEPIYGIAFSPTKTLLAATADGRLLQVNTGNADVTTLGQISGASGINGLTGIRTLLSPVRGSFRNTGTENPQCDNAGGLWTFCQHQTDFHKPGGIRIPASNETLAWDMNLTANADKGLPVFAVAPGRIVKYGGECLPCATFGGVLVEHTSPDGTKWWTGYVHMTGIPAFQVGDFVTTTTRLGNIGSTGLAGSNREHLHFAVYSGQNRKSKLVSRDALFAQRKP